MPPGVRPDTFEGRTYLGLIPFRMVGAALGPAPPSRSSDLPRDQRAALLGGRARAPGIVFRSLDADRLAVVLGARLGLGLPYVWSRMRFRTAADGALAYATLRRTGECAAASCCVPGP